MTDRPILFKGPMVRAILDGRKTQTRRVLKQQPDDDAHLYDAKLPCQPGDRLWVREAWRIGAWSDNHFAVDYHADNLAQKEWLRCPSQNMADRLTWQSQDDAKAAGLFREGAEFEYRWSPGNSPCRGRPSIHMPKWVSRLTLVVTDVRAQRLQDISDKDAAAEGWPGTSGPETPKPPVIWFRDLWNATYGPEAWEANPWVSAITFETHHCNIDQMGESA